MSICRKTQNRVNLGLKNVFLCQKLMFLCFRECSNNGIHLLPPMDLALAHVQIKYKHTAASPPVVRRTAASPSTTPPVAPLRCP
jgi:hypothetical protein